MRIIDADALWEKMYKYSDNEGAKMPYGDDDSLIHRDSACFLIEKAPTITPEPHWIPVTERLPEDDTVVLVCGKGGGIYTAIHNNSKTWIRGWWKMNSKNHHCNPIAWMPLPEPYKGVTE